MSSLNADATKTALVTGASSGMGKAIAGQLIRDGLTVVVAARRIERMDDLRALGAHPIGLDLTKEESIVAAVQTIAGTHGGVDVLVNNAGFGLAGAVEDVPLAEARRQLEVNLFGPARLTQLLLPYMRSRRSGTIVNITSMGGKIYTPLAAWYHASKHALEGWSDCLRLEVSPFGIDVVVVEPGMIRTEFGDVLEASLLRFSGDGPYAPMARNVGNAMVSYYRKGGGSSPQVIADVVSAAVRTRRPRTRYAAGRLARTMIFLRKWFGDRVFDRVVMRMAR